MLLSKLYWRVCHRFRHLLHHPDTLLHAAYFGLVTYESQHLYAFAAAGLLFFTVRELFTGE